MISFIPAIVFIGIAAFLPRGDELGLESSADYYGFITGALFLFAAFVAPEAVCTDRRSGMLGLYLASPLSRDTYLVAKAAAIAAVLGTMTLGPPILMLIAYTLADAGPDGVTGWLTELDEFWRRGLRWPFSGRHCRWQYPASPLAAPWPAWAFLSDAGQLGGR